MKINIDDVEKMLLVVYLFIMCLIALGAVFSIFALGYMILTGGWC